MTTVGFLHTAQLHVPVFEALVAEVGESAGHEVSAVSVVDPGLLATARNHGPDHPDVVAGLVSALDELARAGADRVVCTCSTIGGVAESLGGRAGVEVVRVDRAMAERAVAVGGRVVVLAALESTLGPTHELLSAVAADRGVEVELDLRVVSGAWERFEAGDLDGYHRAVAHAAELAAAGADAVVLAQTSMAPAAALVAASVPVLTSPRPAVESVVARR